MLSSAPTDALQSLPAGRHRLVDAANDLAAAVGRISKNTGMTGSKLFHPVMSNAIEELPGDLACALALLAQERARRVAAEAEAEASRPAGNRGSSLDRIVVLTVRPSWPR